MTALLVTIPLRLPSAANLREHWAAKAKRVKQQRQAVAMFLGGRPRPALPLVVTLTRIAPRALDGDNLQGAFKGPRDEVARWLGVDDADARVTWRYDQRKGAAKTYAIEIAFSPRVLGLDESRRQRVAGLLAEGKGWPEIGRLVSWEPRTLQAHYERDTELLAGGRS